MNYQSQSYSSDYNEDGGDGFGDFPTTNRNVNDILNDNRWKANKEKNSFNEQYSQSNVNGWQNGLGSLNINDLNSQTYMNHDNNQNSNNNHNNSQNYSNTMNGNHYENTENEIDNQQRLMNFLNNDPHDKQQYDNNHNNNQNNGINYDDFNNNYSNYNDIDDGRLNIAHITGDSDSDLSDSDEKYNHGKIDKTNREKIDKDVKIKKKRERKGKKSNKLSTPLVTEHTANASQSIQQSIAASTGPPISSVSYTQHSTQPSVQPSAAVSTEVNTQNMHGLLGPGHPSIHPSTHPSMHSSIGRTRGPSTAFYPNENNTLLPGLSLSPGNDPQYEQTLRINSYNNINKNDGHDGYLLSNLTVEGDSHLNGIRSDLYQGTGGQGSVLGTSRRDVASSRRRGPLIDKAIDNSLPDHTTITSNAGDSSNSSGNSNSNSSSSSNDISDVSDSPFSWVCKKCTYKHDELSERRLVACSLCGSDRYPTAAPPVQASVPVSVGNNILTSSSWGAKMAMAEKKIKEKEKESSGENGFTDVGGRSKKKVEVVVDDNEYAYNGKYDKYSTTPTSTDYSQAPRVGGGSVVYCHDYQNTRGLCSRGDKCRYVHEKDPKEFWGPMTLELRDKHISHQKDLLLREKERGGPFTPKPLPKSHAAPSTTTSVYEGKNPLGALIPAQVSGGKPSTGPSIQGMKREPTQQELLDQYVPSKKDKHADKYADKHHDKNNDKNNNKNADKNHEKIHMERGGKEENHQLFQWYCSACTFCHDESKQQDLRYCILCGSERK